MAMTHKELVEDLADSFDSDNNMIFRECKLTSTWYTTGIPIPDVVVIKKSYNFNVTIHEVKASTADLKKDVFNAKWEKYRPYCHRLFFAVGPEVDYQKTLSGFPVGIKVRGPKGWRAVKPAPPIGEHGQDLQWSNETWLAVAMNHFPTIKGMNAEISRMEHEKEMLLKGDLDKLYSSVNPEIDRKLNELKEAESRAKDLKNAIWKDVKEAVKAAAGVDLWIWESDPNKFFAEFYQKLFEKVAEETADRFLKGLKAIENTVA